RLPTRSRRATSRRSSSTVSGEENERRRQGPAMKDLLLALPRLLRMITSLLGDKNVPLAAKIVLGGVAVYLASPIDLIPDSLPFVGLLDDVLLAAIVVDGLLNHVDRPLVQKYWPGSPASLDAAAAAARRLAAWVPSGIKARIFSGRRQPA